jgi:hypothetical protein
VPTATFERFDYRVRPAKSVERRMMCDAFRRLSPFGSIRAYRYIGFGANSFVDFILFHRQLGIDQMISIESHVDLKQRIEFNCPFKCIDVRFGLSSAVLPNIDWSVRSIVWLDYDKSLKMNMLSDIKTVAARAAPGTFVCVSVAADVGADENDDSQVNPQESEPDRRLRRLSDRLPARIPRYVSGKHLKGWGTASVFREIITNEIDAALAERNGLRAAGATLQYRQLFNFNYADGAKMMTCGGMIIDHGQQAIFSQCDFNALDFVRRNREPYLIEVPTLTLREVRRLEEQLPRTIRARLALPGVSKADINAYAKIYRYWHPFAAIET